MTTLIVPCAGRSSRFPNMRPKWMLTHPSGKLMIEEALSGLDLDRYTTIIITIVRRHAEEYEAEIILRQVFEANPRIQICVLDDFTKSASETVYKTLEKMNVTGAFVIKDSDNMVAVTLPGTLRNSIVCYDLHRHPEISNIPGKSFIIQNEQNIIQDIIEKKVVSNIISLGVYCFESAEEFKSAYLGLVNSDIPGEMFVSHVISYMIYHARSIFQTILATSYEDWGTLHEWRDMQQKHRSFFVDVDGVILKNSGRYGTVRWENNKAIIEENLKLLAALQKNGAQIIITTSRPESFKPMLQEILSEYGITPVAFVMGLHHAPRVVINDFASTNPYPSCTAISLPRDTVLKDYL